MATAACAPNERRKSTSSGVKRCGCHVRTQSAPSRRSPRASRTPASEQTPWSRAQARFRTRSSSGKDGTTTGSALPTTAPRRPSPMGMARRSSAPAWSGRAPTSVASVSSRWSSPASQTWTSEPGTRVAAARATRSRTSERFAPAPAAPASSMRARWATVALTGGPGCSPDALGVTVTSRGTPAGRGPSEGALRVSRPASRRRSRGRSRGDTARARAARSAPRGGW